MTRTPISRSFRLLTPAFVHGAYQSQKENIPELRAPSVRGQLRWWWRTLGYGTGDKIFGSASGDTGTASKVQIRLESPFPNTLAERVQLLPHKNQGPKSALAAETDLFTARLLPVRTGITPDELEKLTNALDAWLLMGGIGQRANRSAGSLWPEGNAPTSCEDYLARCRKLLADSSAKIALLDFQSGNFHEIRVISGNFPQQSPGKVFGSAQPRKSSSLKLRAVHLDGAYRIAALWCPKDRDDTPANLRSAISQMKNFPQKAGLGSLLEKALPELV